MKILTSIEEYNNFIGDNAATLIYFSTPQCNVCKVLKPKLIEFINTKFSNIKMGYVDSESLPEVAAQNSIFTVPIILVFLDKKEFIRKSRNINLIEFQNEMERPYSLFFNN
jgi:thioredoxin